MALTYYITKNSTSTSTTGYYTIDYRNGYYTTNNYAYTSGQSKSKQDYKNSEVKHLLQEERGW